MKKTFINPIQVSTQQKQFPEPSGLHKKLDLEQKLRSMGLDITLGEELKGGFISQVYGAHLKNHPVVVKHTENLIPFDPTELFCSSESHLLDSQVRKLLQNSKSVRVPKMIEDFPDIKTSIMEDLRGTGYSLLSENILHGQLPLNSPKKIGRMLSQLIIESRDWPVLEVTQDTTMSIYERGLELRLAYPNSQKEYLELEQTYIENSQFWTWPDAHPKNILITPQGDCAFIDFGFSQYGDQRFTLATFLAHIILYALSGYSNKNDALTFIFETIEGYTENESIDEEMVCKYLAMEVLHRAYGKWVSGIDKPEHKVKNVFFGLSVFDEEIATIIQLGDLLKSIK